MRNSFENFVDSRLSDILEFEDETVRQSLIQSHSQPEQLEQSEQSQSQYNSQRSGNNSTNSEFITKLLTSSLGPADRLSNGCKDIEKYPLKIPVIGGTLNCTISSSIVSAMVYYSN